MGRKAGVPNKHHHYLGIVEEYLRIDRRAITARGLWIPGAWGRIPVNTCGTLFAAVEYTGDCVNVYSRARLVQSIAVEYRDIALPHGHRGKIYYLLCPRCNKGAYALFSRTGYPGTFACRWCLKLVSRWQTHHDTQA